MGRECAITGKKTTVGRRIVRKVFPRKKVELDCMLQVRVKENSNLIFKELKLLMKKEL